MQRNKSKKIWENSKNYIVGGVNSPVRSFSSIDTFPVVIKKGKGCYIYDEDKNSYIDFCNSFGPLILGHSHKSIVKVLKKKIKKGTSFGTITKKELQISKFIYSKIPFIEKIRFVNSGTEAVMTAIRVARGYTEKKKIIKFGGCYHGHSDSLLVKAGSGLIKENQNIIESTSLGIPTGVIQDTIVLELGNRENLESTIKKNHNEIACIIIEPLPANAGLLKQSIEFLEDIRNLSQEYNIVLIFDEVITGFRLGIGGFAEKYKIYPDIATYGKIIGGGFPVGAVGGKKEIMDQLAPIGGVYQAGTLSGNPIALSAGFQAIKFLLKNNHYEKLSNTSNYLKYLYRRKIIPLFLQKRYYIDLIQEDSIFWLNIQDNTEKKKPVSIEEIWKDSPKIYNQIYLSLLQNGIYLAPSCYEVCFLSTPMRKKDIDFFIKILKKSIININ